MFGLIFIFAFLFLGLAGCSDNSVDAPQAFEFNGSISYNDFWSSVNKPGQTGKIELTSTYMVFSGNDAGDSDFNEDSFIAEAKFFNSPGEYIPEDSIKVNGTLLLKDARDYVYYAGGNNKTKEGLILNYGDEGNRIQNVSGESVPLFDSTMVFSEPVRFKNISSGDELNRDIDLNLTWSGTGPEHVNIEISGMNTSNVCVGSGYTENDGVFRISENDMERFPKGEYRLSIKKFEPHWIQLDNGSKIQVISITEDIVNINLI